MQTQGNSGKNDGSVGNARALTDKISDLLLFLGLLIDVVRCFGEVSLEQRVEHAVEQPAVIVLLDYRILDLPNVECVLEDVAAEQELLAFDEQGQWLLRVFDIAVDLDVLVTTWRFRGVIFIGPAVQIPYVDVAIRAINEKQILII